MKRIVIAVGGTGGHVYPALALADQLNGEQFNPFFVGGGLGLNPYFDRDRYGFQEISTGTIELRDPLSWFSGLYRNSVGFFQSIRTLHKLKPALVVGFGSYYSLPVLLAATVLRIPILLHEQNSIPGKVNRLISRFAMVTGTFFPNASEHLEGKSVAVDFPIRQHKKMQKEEARKAYGLDPEKLTILVFGGSQGARALNQLVPEALSENQGIQVLHFVGKFDPVDEIRSKYQELGISAHVKAFEERMDRAWQAADLMISRSGAGTVAEQVAFEVPGILIPYPFAMDDHQEHNADYMVEEIGGAVKLTQSTIQNGELEESIQSLLEGSRLESMQKSIQEYKSKDRAAKMKDLVKEYANG